MDQDHMKTARLTGSPRFIWIAFIWITLIWSASIFIAIIQESSDIVLGLVRLVLLYQAILNCSNEAFSHPSILARLSPQTQVQLWPVSRMCPHDWGSLTEYVLLRVFSLLEPRCLQLVAGVCRHWGWVAADDWLWREHVRLALHPQVAGGGLEGFQWLCIATGEKGLKWVG